MECMKMYNPDHQSHYPIAGPRISFSSDFSLECPPPTAHRNTAGPSDPDFEFSVGSHQMMAADQLFFKGRILPLKDSTSHANGHRVTTLRDELRTEDRGSSERPPKAIRWKELLGLRKGGHSKRGENKSELESVSESESTDVNFRRFSTQEPGMRSLRQDNWTE
ncbi:hypothetical protein LUZ61_008735 [Rhynchospora tenuis]|uniref:Uncharacterized protein n=1 Tax=Rhynchospora tenuis TaxID=198213 RepID=A0AAD5ZVW1_9POAL|nr:hypothetical protein LUZ61_008735 [Rhynchospora tenuis]